MIWEPGAGTPVALRGATRSQLKARWPALTRWTAARRPKSGQRHVDTCPSIWSQTPGDEHGRCQGSRVDEPTSAEPSSVAMSPGVLASVSITK